MRRLVALGAFSLAGALIGACSDDDVPIGSGGSAGRAGSGGSAGTTGNAGNAGVGGMPGNGGTGGGNAGTGGSSAGTGGSSAGTGGTGGSGVDPDAGDGGGGPPCTGCLELTVPVTGSGTNQATLFQFNLDAAGEDFSTAVITFRVRALQLDNNFFVQAFAQDANFSFDSVFRSMNAGGGFANTDDFVDLVYDLAAAPSVDVLFPDAGGLDGGSPDPGDFDKSTVRQFGVIVGAGTGYVGAATTVTVLLDSVTFDGIARPDVTFTASAEGFAVNTFSNPAPGSEATHHPE